MHKKKPIQIWMG